MPGAEPSDSPPATTRRRLPMPQGRSARALTILIVVMLAASAFFGLRVYRQLETMKSEQLRSLRRAVDDAESLIGVSLENVHNHRGKVRDRLAKIASTSGDGGNLETLAKQIDDFAQRQPYLVRSAGETCTEDREGGGLLLDVATSPPSVVTDVCVFSPGGVAGRRLAFALDLDKLIDRVRPRYDFETIILFDASGDLLAETLASGQGSSALKLGAASSAAGDAEGGGDGGGAARALGLPPMPLVQTWRSPEPIEGLDYDVACQPLRVPASLDEEGRAKGFASWALCGAVPRVREMKEAFALAPGRSAALGLLALLGVALVPFVKPLFMSRHERLTRIDLAFLATGTLLGLSTLTVALLAGFFALDLRDRFDRHLRSLNEQVATSLRTELTGHLETLRRVDAARCAPGLAGKGSWVQDEPGDDRVGRETLLLDRGRECAAPDEDGRRLACLLGEETALFASVFWVAPDGLQMHKATTKKFNTTSLDVSRRGYVSRLWDRVGWPESLLAAPRDKEDVSPDRQVVAFTDLSITTGRPFFALSRDSDCSREGLGAEGDVAEFRSAVLSGNLLAMDAVVTPPFDFAVVDGAATVVASSSEQLRVGLDLTAEIDAPEGLRAALASASEVALEADLGVRSHEFFIRPFLLPARAADGWWIVTFYDEELTSTLVAELVSLSLAPVLVLVTIFAVVAVLGRRKLRDLIWPRKVLIDFYFWVCLLLGGYLLAVLLCAPSCFSAWSRLAGETATWSGSLLRLLLPALVPAALLLVAHGLRHWSSDWARDKEERTDTDSGQAPDKAPDEAPRNAPDTATVTAPAPAPAADSATDEGKDKKKFKYTFWRDHELDGYRVAVFLFWACLGVLPAMLWVEAAWELESTSLARGDARWWHEEMEQRRRGVESEWRDLVAPDVLARRLEATGDRFWVEPFWAADVSHGADVRHVFEPLAASLPTYNATTARLRHQWSGAPPQADPLFTDGSASRRSAGFFLLFVVLLAVVVAVTVHSIRESLRFKMDRPGPPEPLEKVLSAAGQPGTRTLIVLTSNEQWQTARALPGPRSETVDLAGVLAGDAQKNAAEETPDKAPDGDTTAGTAPKTGKDAKTETEPPDGPMYVFGLAQAMADPNLREGALSALAGALRRSGDRPVLVFTGMDPWPLLIDAAASGQGSEEAAGIVDLGDARRWAEVLGELTTEYAGVTWPAKKKTKKKAENGSFDSFYWSSWWRCSREEQLALLQLAEEGFLNPKQAPAVVSLLRRNILTFDENRPLSYKFTHFRHFVYRAARSRQLEAWEHQEAGRDGWKGLRYAFGLFFLALFGFLFLVDQSLLSNVQALLTAMIALAPIAFSLGKLSPATDAKGD